MVIFDFDGVIVDSEPPSNRLLAELFSACGARMDAAEAMRRFTGVPHAECLRQVERDFGVRVPDDFEARYAAASLALYRDVVQPIAGIQALVPRHRGAFAIASGSPLRKIRLGLARVGLTAQFGDRVFSAEQVARSKPYPDVYLLAIERLGQPAAQGVAVEDSPTGATAAVAAGLTVFGLVGHCSADALAAVGARPVASLAELDRQPDFRRAAGWSD